jgi:DNA-binding transcriptional MocR family regulator
MDAATLDTFYLQLAAHYRQAIASGVLAPGARMPSVRALMRTHRVSLSTALQACRSLEDEACWKPGRAPATSCWRPGRRCSAGAGAEPGATALAPEARAYSGIRTSRISW